MTVPLPSLHTHYVLTVEVLSPLHIGDGNRLLQDIDFLVHDNRTWVINQETLWERTVTADGTFDDQLLARPASELISDDDFGSRRPFRYVLPGVPANDQLRTFIKNVFDQPYLPGSTIKGLLRTLAVWGSYASQKLVPDLNRLGRSPTFAAQPVERDVMGQTRTLIYSVPCTLQIAIPSTQINCARRASTFTRQVIDNAVGS